MKQDLKVFVYAVLVAVGCMGVQYLMGPADLEDGGLGMVFVLAAGVAAWYGLRVLVRSIDWVAMQYMWPLDRAAQTAEFNAARRKEYWEWMARKEEYARQAGRALFYLKCTGGDKDEVAEVLS